MNASLFWTIATVLIPLLLPFGVALAAVLSMSLLQRLPMQQRLIVSSMAHTVVRAVEQMAQAHTPGSQKKDLALHALVSILGGIGVKVPAPMLETAIEAAVFELHTMYPHGVNSADAAPSDLAGPFSYKPTLRSLPAVQQDVGPSAPTAQLPRDNAPTAPTEPIPLTTDKRPS